MKAEMTRQTRTVEEQECRMVSASRPTLTATISFKFSEEMIHL